MPRRLNRRDFVKAGTAAGLAAAARQTAYAQAPAVVTSSKPIVVSSANGHRYKNGGPVTCVE
jgi:uncharacterized protein (DUF1501 family)